jgi:hypothetical protein
MPVLDSGGSQANETVLLLVVDVDVVVVVLAATVNVTGTETLPPL